MSQWYLCFLLFAVSGCAVLQPQPTKKNIQSRASVPQLTQTHEELTSLPNPRGVLRAAVYSFRDYTGQYKPQPSNGLSTAVTQGADSILLNVLLDSKWFAPVERANLQNLLTERKILQSSLVDEDDNVPELQSVAPAEVILEGSIVSYDSNTQTGGSGLRILGLGASTSYREDRVTISIRLIDIDNGLILHNVVSTKRVFSRKLDTGIFSYVDADQILEAEAGYSVNEPSHIAVTEAIESAIINLIAEGVISGTLQLADAEDVQSEVFDRFLTDNQRDSFLTEKRLAAKRQLEQKKHADAVGRRMRDGLAGLHRYRLTVERQREQQAKFARNRSRGKSQLHTAKRAPTDDSQIRTVAAVAKSTTTQKSTSGNTRPSAPRVKLPSTEQLITNQSQAILRAQAETQVRATRQAHQAALYAQQLILKQEAQLRENRQSNNNAATQSNVSSSKRNQPLGPVKPISTNEES